MPKLDDFVCSTCNEQFEFLKMSKEELIVCPKCESNEVVISPGGHLFTKIVPTTKTSKRHKAGYVHEFTNRPAEKISISVPKKIK